MLRRWPLATGGGVFLVLVGYFWLSGTLMPTEWAPPWTSALQLTGMALSNSAIPAYLIASYGYATRRTGEFVRDMVADGVLSQDAGARRLAELDHIPAAHVLPVLAAGFLLGALNVPWSELSRSLSGPTPAIEISVSIGALILWGVVAQVGYRQIRSARIFSAMGREDAEVDLHRPLRLNPIGRAGTLNVLIIIGALSLMSLQSLDAELRWYNYFTGFVVGIPAGVTLLLLPMFGIRERIRAEKAAELGRIDRAVAEASRELSAGALAHLSDLLAMRERVRGVHDWPMDMTTYRRVGLYVIIPPLAWIGAAVVEMVLASALD